MTESNQIKLERWKGRTRILPYGKIGYGYIVNPNDPHDVIPNPDEIIILEAAFDYIDNGASWREVCEWTSQKLLKPIVHQTIKNLYNLHRKPFINRKTNRKDVVQPRQSKEAIELANAKRAVHRAVKKAKALENKPLPDRPDGRVNNGGFKIPEAVSYLPPVPKDVAYAFTPNKGPQMDFLSAPEEEVLFGGAAGGGKSMAMIADPMRYFDNPNFVGLLLRRTNDELRELKWETMKLYPKIWPGAKWKEKDSMWVFPSGAKFWMTYLERDEDVQRYVGQSFCWIGVDELTQYASPFAWQFLKSRLRSTDPELQKTLCMRATTNPGGPGHQWVKKMFIDPQVPNKAFWATDLDTGEIQRYPLNHHDPSKAGKPLFKRRFIPSLLKDNPYLFNDGNYERGLLGLPEAQRRKLLEGDWSIVEGAAFAEFSPKHHVCEPFDIPHDWRRFRGADYGYASPSCVLWFAIDPSFDTLYVYRELYGPGMTGLDLAHKVLTLEDGERISYGVLDSSVWHERGLYGPTVAEEMIAAGCRWRPSDRGKGSRTAGKNRLHELLKLKEQRLDEPAKPSIVFFNTCRQLIADLPSIPVDPDMKDDIDARYTSDHTYDALRYGIMSRPRSASPLDWGREPMDRYTPADSTFGY